MPAPKRLWRYPLSYWRLMKRSQTHSVRLLCRDKSEAENIRRDFYNFRSVLRSTAAQSADDRLLTYSLLADRLSFAVKGNVIVVWAPGKVINISEDNTYVIG